MQGIRLFVAVLAALVICGTGIALAAQDESDSGEPSTIVADPSEASQEIPGSEVESKRTATSNTYRLPGGALETQLYENPVNYRDSEGDWQPIEEGLEYEGKALTNGANSFDLSLPAKMGAGAVRLSEGNHWVSYELLGEETQPAELEEGIAGYETPGQGPSFVLSGLANGVKEQIELTDPSRPSSFRFELDASQGLTPSIEADGSLAFRDSEGEAFAVLPAPTVTDSSPEAVASSDAVGYALKERSEGGWLLTLEVDREWLLSPDRSWPVEVDPTLTVESPSLDCTFGSLPAPEGWHGCGSSGKQELLAAYNQKENQPSRSLLKFNVGSLPKTAYVTGTTLSLNSPTTAENTAAVQIRRATKPWTSQLSWRYYAVNPATHTGLPWTTPGGDYTSEGAEVLTSQRGSGAGLWNFSSPELTQVVQNWAGGKVENQGLLVKNSNESKAECEANPEKCGRRYVEFNSSAAADSHVRPKLSVTYLTPAPSTSKLTSPIEGTVTGRRLKLKAAWSSGVTGVTFQYRDPGVNHEVKPQFQTIPTELIRNAKGESVSWPVAVSGVTQTESLYFDAAHADSGLQKAGGPIEVRALFYGSTGEGYSDPVKATVSRSKGGPRDGSAGVGPGSVDLLSGNYTIARTDVSIPGFGSALEFGRSWNSAEPQTGAAGVLGPGWSPSAAVEAAGGSEWQSIKEVLPSAEEVKEYAEYEEAAPPGYVLLTDLEGTEYSFEISGSGFVIPPEATGWGLKREGSAGIALTDSEGNRTLFEQQSGSNEYKPVSISQTGANKTQLIWEFVNGVRRLKRVIAPSAGTECTDSNAATTLGCRSLKLTYQSIEYEDSHHQVQHADRLTTITYYGSANGSTMESWEVARYSYDAEGRLSGEWDPRIHPNLVEGYAYDKSSGELLTLTPPGEEPWSFDYYSGYDGETGSGRLKDVKRASLLGEPSTAQTTIVYGVPLSGSGAPYEMGAASVAQWGQQSPPADATAIFPPDQVPANPPSSWSRATVYYLDVEGQVLNTATPSGAGTSAPSITTSEYDEYGNVVRELSAQNRLRALAAGSESEKIAKSHELETKRVFNAAGTEPGTEMQEEWGPMHQVRLESGEVKPARLHRTVEYDKEEPAPPSGTPYAHLPTGETTGASIPGQGIDADQRVTTTKYNWTLRKPTDTFVDPTGLNLHTHVEYDTTSGLPTERRLPGNPEGGDAHTTKIIYYTVGTNPLDSSCTNKPAWANLPCKTLPAKQPTLEGRPELLVTTYLAYNQLGEPTEVSESPGGGASNVRKTITTYDEAGREKTSKQEGGGTALPKTETLYSSTMGMPTGRRFVCETGCSGFDNQETTTTYDKLGRPKEYEDADGNLSSTTYDLDGRPVTTSDGKGIQTRTYDSTSGLLVKLEDSGAGTFTAAYDADGNLVEEGLPDGLLAKTTFNEAGEPTHLSYEKKTFCSLSCTWLDFGAERSIYGQVLSQSSLASSQQYSYDKAGRLEIVRDTPQGGGCTTRSYSFDADSNRTALVTRAPGIGGACDLSSKGTPQEYKYDAADRLTTPAGISYDNYGRITSLPASDAGGSTLTTSYYSNDLVKSQTQGAITNSYELDGALRQRTRTETGGSEPGTEVYHYASGSDSPAWIDRGSSWSRNVAGIAGGLAAIQDSAKGTTLQLTNLHGDIVATASTNPEATKLLASFEFDEFGNPKSGSAGKYGWLGSKGRRTELPSGVIQMGVRSYVPALGRFLTPDPIQGGSANAYDYAYQDPVNMFDLAGLCGHRGEMHSCSHIYEERDRIRRKTNRISKERQLHAPVVTTRGCTALACRVGWPHGGHNDALGSFLEGTASKVVHLLVKYGTNRAMSWASSTENERSMSCAKDASEAWRETSELRAAGAGDPPLEAGTTITSVLYAAASCVGGVL